jgi:hypothetical protein
MNKKQKAKRLKRLNAQIKMFKKTGHWSIRSMANADLKESQSRDNRYE